MKSSIRLEKSRNFTLDLIKFLCLLLMITDHLFFLTIKYNGLIWQNSLNSLQINLLHGASFLYDGKLRGLRTVLRSAVLLCFFYIAGISCSLSRNNSKRLGKLAFMALFITLSTYFISIFTPFKMFISWGVISCYAGCLFIFMLIKKLIKNDMWLSSFCIVFLFIGFIITCFRPVIESSNILMPLGIPSKSFKYDIEYFPIFKWLGIYFIGVVVGNNYFSDSHIKLSNFASTTLISKVSKNSAYIYLFHFIFIFIFLKIIDLF